MSCRRPAPDTSPRDEKVPADPEGSWDFGHGAGFYVDASQAGNDHSFFFAPALLTTTCATTPLPFWAESVAQGNRRRSAEAVNKVTLIGVPTPPSRPQVHGKMIHG
jgi:hypothetical protein